LAKKELVMPTSAVGCLSSEERTAKKFVALSEFEIYKGALELELSEGETGEDSLRSFLVGGVC